MRNLIIKGDRAVLDHLTQYVRRWIERHDEKKHAIDFMIRFEWVQFAGLIVWAIAIPAALYVVEGNTFGAVVQVVVWSMLAVMEWMGIQYTTNVLKPQHDLFWSLREEPSYVKMHAEVLDEVFVRTRRKRLETHVFIIGLTGLLFLVSHFALSDAPNNMVWQYLFVNAIANRLKGYLLFVNDMEPPKSKKKASEAISEMLAQLWADLVGGFAPTPAPAFATK
jgi:hypothetical protein